MEKVIKKILKKLINDNFFLGAPSLEHVTPKFDKIKNYLELI